MILRLEVLVVDSKESRILDLSEFLVVRCMGLVMMSGVEILGVVVDVG
jgi:hypothetical protein